MISFRDAYLILLAQKLELKSQKTPLFDAYGKVLSKDIFVLRNLPAFSNSAMDGYAVSKIAQEYFLKGAIFAGEKGGEPILPHHCTKIMTGAVIPSNALAVIPFEHTKIEGEKIIPLYPIKEYQNIKFCGEDYKQGELLLSCGERLDFASLSLLASQGISEVCTYQAPKIAIFSSGDEVKEPWEKAEDFQIYNTNAIAYHAILQENGLMSEYRGILPDCKEKLTQAVRDFRQYDIVLTSGGASVGEADFFEEVLRENQAEILFHGINLKPGRPMLVARLGDTLILSLPGNPLSGVLNLITLALPAIRKLCGEQKFEPLKIRAKIKGDLILKGKRTHMILGFFDGEFFAPFEGGKYGSGSLVPLQKSNAIAVFEEGIERVLDGETILLISHRAMGKNLCDDMGKII